MLPVKHYIDGQEISPAIVNQFDVTQEVSFVNDEIQANIDSDQYEFILEGYEKLIAIIIAS